MPANKKITQLTAGTVLDYTDLLVKVDDPSGFPTDQKITADLIFTEPVSGSLVIDRDTQLLNDLLELDSLNWNLRRTFDSGGDISQDWQLRQLLDGGGVTVSFDWDVRLAKDIVGVNSFNYTNRMMFDVNGDDSASWASRILYNTGEDPTLDWEQCLLYDTANFPSENWNSRRLIGPDGSTVVFDWNVNQASGRVFNAPSDPNGVKVGTKPDLCWGDDGSIWVKTSGVATNTGWEQLS